MPQAGILASMGGGRGQVTVKGNEKVDFPIYVTAAKQRSSATKIPKASREKRFISGLYISAYYLFCSWANPKACPNSCKITRVCMQLQEAALHCKET